MSFTTTKSLHALDVQYNNSGDIESFQVAYSFLIDDPNDDELPVTTVVWKALAPDADVSGEVPEVIAMHQFLFPSE